MAPDLRLRPRPRLRFRLSARRTRRRNGLPGGYAAGLVQPRRRDRSNRDRRRHPAADLETSPTTAIRHSPRSRLLDNGRPGRRLLADRANNPEIICLQPQRHRDTETGGLNLITLRLLCPSVPLSLCPSVAPWLCGSVARI